MSRTLLEYRLCREPSTDEGTPGMLTAPDGTSWCTLELPWRNNTRCRSCIPSGSYACRIVDSPKFGLVYHVQNVPGRSEILIHAGNTGGDVSMGFKSNVQGCILPGLRFGQLYGQLAVLDSRKALKSFMAHAGRRPFTLVISWIAPA